MTTTPPADCLRSMTGFAAQSGAFEAHRWSWEMRSVNGKGLDIRLRVPDWIDGLEAALRPLVSAAAKRGNVTVSLRLAREDSAVATTVNMAQAAAAIAGLRDIADEAKAQGLDLAPARVSDIALMRGVMEQSASQDDPTPLRAALIADVADLIAAFDAMRLTEGAALTQILTGQLDAIEDLVGEAETLAEARKDDVAATLKRNLARVLDNADGADPDRVAQELALLAVKADITEELDRLRTHVAAARDHLSEGGSVGRKLDFLMQEFNREANTLCSKAQNADLTKVGLALKALIDQMREQVQNVE